MKPVGRRFRFLATVALSLVCGAPFLAPAQSDAPSRPRTVDEETLLFEDIPTVYGASGYDQKVTEAPSSVSIVTSDEIRKYGFRNLADILRSMRGFYTSYDRNYTYLGVRGFAWPGDYNSRILILVDGHRINDTVYDQGPIGNDFIVDVDLIDRVEVIRGPSSSLYGSNAFFAVINVVMRTGRDVRGIEASAEAGRFETYKGRLSYGDKFGSGLEAILSGTLARSEGQSLFFPEFDDPTTNNGIADKKDGEKHGSLFGTVSYGDLTLQAAYVSRDKDIPTGSYGTLFNAPGNRTTDKRYYADLRYERAVAPQSNLTVRIFYDWYQYLGDYVFEDDTVNPIPPFDYMNKDETVNEWWGAEARMTRTMFESHKVTAGAEFRDTLRQDQKNFNVSPYSLLLDDRRSTRVDALYVQDEFAIRENLILNAGVRYDHYQTFGGTANPRVVLIANPYERATVKLIYGRAFRAPNAYELYYADGGVSMKANSALGPESIQSYEAVWEQFAGDHVRVLAAGYYYKIKNLIAQRIDPADGLLVFRNEESVRAKGLEAEAEGRWGGGFEGRASYSYGVAKDPQTGRGLVNSPKHLAKLNLIAPLLKNKLFSGLETQYSSRRATLAGNAAGGYTVANVTLYGQNLLKGLDVSASVYNLLNKKYGNPGGAEHVQDILAQDGRTFRLKVTGAF